MIKQIYILKIYNSTTKIHYDLCDVSVGHLYFFCLSNAECALFVR